MPQPAPAPALPDPPRMRRRLLAWFDAHRRDLPWRRTRDPWAILVSEVMLQQTTVSAVVPYYERFLERWPTPAHLAREDTDALLAAWSGLGYYRRAHLLKAAAEAVCETADGRLPRDVDGLRALPGIGEYTAAAVSSIAHGAPVPTVDGNVERVLTRLLALPGDPKKAPTRRILREAAQALLAPRRPGDFNQAMMELGATVCRPRSPACPDCPLGALCAARAQGDPTRFPHTPPRQPPTAVLRLALVALRRGRVLVQRREGPPNAGFLELPGVEVQAADTSEPAPDDPAPLVAALAVHGLDLRPGAPLPPHRHAITRYRITVRPYRAAGLTGRVRPPLRWHDPRDDSVPLTTATRRILAASFPEAFRP